MMRVAKARSRAPLRQSGQWRPAAASAMISLSNERTPLSNVIRMRYLSSNPPAWTVRTIIASGEH
jgi:hypothetical protein